MHYNDSPKSNTLLKRSVKIIVFIILSIFFFPFLGQLFDFGKSVSNGLNVTIRYYGGDKCGITGSKAHLLGSVAERFTCEKDIPNSTFNSATCINYYCSNHVMYGLSLRASLTNFEDKFQMTKFCLSALLIQCTSFPNSFHKSLLQVSLPKYVCNTTALMSYNLGIIFSKKTDF